MMLPARKSLLWPTVSKRVTSPFGPRELSADGFHDGIDIGAITQGVEGDPIFACEAGQVIRCRNNPSGYGHYVIINHNGFSSLYAHNFRNAVSVGDEVERGQLIAYMGSSGRSTGPHSHFELRSTEYNTSYWASRDGCYLNAVDPLLYLDDGEPEPEPEINDDLKYLVDQGIFDNGEYWQELIWDDAKMDEVPVSIFVAAMRKIVERD